MDQAVFFEHVRERSGIGGGEAEKAVPVVFAALGELLTADETAALAAQIPTAMAQWLRAQRRAKSMGLDEVYARVAGATALPLPRALELTQAVCRALALQLRPDVRDRLVAHLGPHAGRLFEIPHEGTPSQRPLHLSGPPPSGEGRTLATGRPGPRHPISEAHPDTAQTHSVARSENPHEDSKLSTASGLTQEILHETLADGKPGPSRKIADTQD